MSFSSLILLHLRRLSSNGVFHGEDPHKTAYGYVRMENGMYRRIFCLHLYEDGEMTAEDTYVDEVVNRDYFRNL